MRIRMDRFWQGSQCNICRSNDRAAMLFVQGIQLWKNLTLLFMRQVRQQVSLQLHIYIKSSLVSSPLAEKVPCNYTYYLGCNGTMILNNLSNYRFLVERMRTGEMSSAFLYYYIKFVICCSLYMDPDYCRSFPPQDCFLFPATKAYHRFN